MSTRREFIKQLSVGLFTVSLGDILVGCSHSTRPKVRFAVFSDLHQDTRPDAIPRLQFFMEQAKKEKVDFIIQLGDLSHGIDSNPVVAIWDAYQGKKYHVLGNHDSDSSTKDFVVQHQKMPGKYYSFEEAGFHFVVLDVKYVRKDGKLLDFEYGNYFDAKQEDRDLITPEELDWLKADLAQTDKPCIIFSHQGLDEVWDGWSSPSRLQVRQIIRDANTQEKKVLACFCGHHHVDAYDYIEGVHYFQINSASGYNSDIRYRDTLYALVTLDLEKRILALQGIKSDFINREEVLRDPAYVDKIYPEIKSHQVKI